MLAHAISSNKVAATNSPSSPPRAAVSRFRSGLRAVPPPTVIAGYCAPRRREMVSIPARAWARLASGRRRATTRTLL